MAGRRGGTAIGLCGVLALLAGCAGVNKVAPDVDATGMSNAELALQRSMDRADAAMRDLGGRSLAARSYAPSAAPAVVPAELQRPETFAWTGPIDAGAKVLADRIGYRLVVTASEKPAPVLVSVNMRDVPVISLFEALGTAAGTQATVIVDPDHHQVEVRHHV